MTGKELAEVQFMERHILCFMCMETMLTMWSLDFGVPPVGLDGVL